MTKLSGVPAYAPLLAAYHVAFFKELQAMLEALPICSGDQVLDVGCGDGDYTRWLVPLVAPEGQVTGVDQSRAYLTQAKRKANTSSYRSQIHFDQGDIRRLPYAANTFDVAWCAQSLFSFPDPQKSLREMTRVVRHGGVVAVLEDDTLHQLLLPWPVEMELIFRQAEWRALQKSRKDPQRFYIARNLRSLFSQAGLQPQRRKTHVFHREFPIAKHERRFMDLYLADLRQRVSPFLSPTEQKRWLPCITRGNRAYLPRQPHFSMTGLHHTLWGKKR